MLRGQKAEDRIDLRDLQLLLPRHIRQDRRQALGEHALAGARRAHQKDIMPACGRDFKCPFGIFLAFDVFEVEKGVRLRLRLPDGRGLHRRFAGQMAHELRHILHAVDGQALGERRLARVGRGDVDRLVTKRPGREGHRQHARHRPQPALQAELAQKRALFLRQPHLLRRAEDAEQDRQVVERTGFLRPRRGEIHDDAADREAEAAVFHGGADALARLLDRRVRQTDQLKGRQARADVAFRLHLVSGNAGQTQRMYLTEHLHPSAFSIVYLYHTAFPAKNQPVFLFRGSTGREFRKFSADSKKVIPNLIYIDKKM